MLSNKIRSIIVEDERSAREALKVYLSKYCPIIQLIGEAANIKEAIPLIQNEKPQLVFLDIEMPFGNAFDVLEATQDIPFQTIFVTAFSEYSLRALNLSAAYYLLKPVSIEELIVAVNKVHQQIIKDELLDRNKIILENIKEPDLDKQQIILPTLEGFDVSKIDKITHLIANGNFTNVYFESGEKKMVCRFLKHFEDVLPNSFIRIHKSHMVNKNYIKSYHKGMGGYVTIHNGTELEVSITYKEAFLSVFK
jgi:two-component system, LytTR family, response regulator